MTRQGSAQLSRPACRSIVSIAVTGKPHPAHHPLQRHPGQGEAATRDRRATNLSDARAITTRASAHSTISAASSTACSSTSAPARAHSLVISSASLCDSPSTQGHMIIAVGATLLIQQAS